MLKSAALGAEELVWCEGVESLAFTSQGFQQIKKGGNASF